MPWYAKLRARITRNFRVTDDIIEFFEHRLVAHGFDAVNHYDAVNAFDAEWAAWTYRKVNETDPFPPAMPRSDWEVGSRKRRRR